MSDRGNDAMLIAAGRHHDSLFDAHCDGCEEPLDGGEGEEFNHSIYCGWCWERLLHRKIETLAEGLMIALGDDE